VFYIRLAIPEHVRKLRPDLPREIRRSTKTTAKQPALRHAREMCAELVTSFNNAGTAMLVSHPSSTPPQGFLIEYVGGRLRTELYPGAIPEVRRLYMHLVETAASFGEGAPATSVPPVATAVTSVPAAAPSEPNAGQGAGEPEGEVVTGVVWLSEAIRDWRTHGAHTFQDHTWRYDYRPSFRLFRELVGTIRRDIIGDDGEIQKNKLDIRLCDLTPDHIRQFHDLLKRLPLRQGKRDDGKEALARIMAADAQEHAVKNLGEKGRPRQTEVNTCKRFEHLKPGVEHMRANGWISKEVSEKFLLELKTASTNLSQARKYSDDPKPGAVSLSVQELCRTFQSPAYINGAVQRDWKYWIPPILLTTAARVAEVSQAYTNDIVYVLGIPCFSFVWDSQDGDDDDEQDTLLGRITRKAKTEEEFRRLKNQASRRIIPIHPDLLQLGFMQWVKRRQAEVGRTPGLLFQELTWEEKSGYGRKPSEYVIELLKTAGVWKKRKKVCHSLRATCIQQLRRVGMPEDDRHRYIGHANKSQEDKSYSETEDGPNCNAEVMLEYLKKMKFGVKFPTYDEILELRAQWATAGQLGRKNSAARRRIEAQAAAHALSNLGIAMVAAPHTLVI
jgi:hypothetical protein